LPENLKNLDFSIVSDPELKYLDDVFGDSVYKKNIFKKNLENSIFNSFLKACDNGNSLLG
jgi:glutamine synthetase type III